MTDQKRRAEALAHAWIPDEPAACASLCADLLAFARAEAERELGELEEECKSIEELDGNMPNELLGIGIPELLKATVRVTKKDVAALIADRRAALRAKA